MGSSRRPLVILSLAALSFGGIVACSQSTAQNPGTGGSGSGGATKTGGSAGSGGALGSGGSSIGSGGMSTGSGGTASTGGQLGGTGGQRTGGATAATGGGPGSGGGGGAGTGVAGAGGGNTTTGGDTGSGGSSTGTGGSANGGRSGTGGSSGTGGNSTALDGGAGAGGTDAAATDGGVTSPGCGKTMNRPNPKTQQTITIGGTTRYYLLDVPSDADNKTPLMLIFALHGYDMNNVSVVGLFNFTSRSGGKAITVYPQGEGPAPGDTSHWGDNVLKSTWMGNEANYSFIRTLMTELEGRYCIDTNRVFLAGFSMGGLFTNFTACDHPDWFRAYAPVEGMGPGGSQDGTQPLSCANAAAKPAIMIHQGTADTSVKPVEGEKTRDFWSTRNGCTKTTTASFTGCQSYTGCEQPVIYCLGSWNHTIDAKATANIWSFFSGLP